MYFAVAPLTSGVTLNAKALSMDLTTEPRDKQSHNGFGLSRCFAFEMPLTVLNIMCVIIRSDWPDVCAGISSLFRTKLSIDNRDTKYLRLQEDWLSFGGVKDFMGQGVWGFDATGLLMGGFRFNKRFCSRSF